MELQKEKTNIPIPMKAPSRSNISRSTAPTRTHSTTTSAPTQGKSQSQNLQCDDCNEQHFISNCETYKNCTPNGSARLVLEKRLCYNSL